MNKSVLVTGSSRGIGQAIAVELARDGYEIVVHCRENLTGAEATLAAIAEAGGQGRILAFDVSDREACRTKLEADIDRHGAYYGVVCNAGIIRDAPFPGLEACDWDAVINTNLNGFYNVLKPVVMPMIQRRKPGRIVTLASMSGQTGNRGQVNYSASKGGLIAGTKALAIELAKRKITVNCVVPGIIDTDMVNDVEWTLEDVLKLIPMHRLGQAHEVAGLVAFLFSEKASYITRQVISVNGGML
ncbi:MAG: 3-ketoacyl-ACP reductase FabG2 [Verrucomicrobia bacterium]|nr:3-ketoacyl-ACP reductase FabG2 [Verrucomicrobiota bacterium]